MSKEIPKLHTERDYNGMTEARHVLNENGGIVGRIEFRTGIYFAYHITDGEHTCVFREDLDDWTLTEYQRADYLVKSLDAIWAAMNPEPVMPESISIDSANLKTLVGLADKGLHSLGATSDQDPNRLRILAIKALADGQSSVDLSLTDLQDIVGWATSLRDA